MLVGGTGYANGTAIATATSGSGSGLTLDITTTNGVVTGATINARDLTFQVDEITPQFSYQDNALGPISAEGTGYSNWNCNRYK